LKYLIQSTKKIVQENGTLPFSVYSSIKEQHLLNVPIIKPLLILILSGSKQLGTQSPFSCPAGTFVFLSNNPMIDMRNIPNDEEYYAVLIEFEYEDFVQFKSYPNKKKKYLQGNISSDFARVLHQFIEWSTFAPKSLWHLRRQELLQFIYHSGYEDVAAIVEAPSLTHQLRRLIFDHITDDTSVDNLADKLAMSESTLRRKLKTEGVSIKTIKDQTRLGYGLHLVQTTMKPIGTIAEYCGYTSQSRFTDKFKHMFGTTPSELRKTRVHD